VKLGQVEGEVLTLSQELFGSELFGHLMVQPLPHLLLRDHHPNKEQSERAVQLRRTDFDGIFSLRSFFCSKKFSKEFIC
jgi:hypothetical protein